MPVSKTKHRHRCSWLKFLLTLPLSAAGLVSWPHLSLGSRINYRSPCSSLNWYAENNEYPSSNLYSVTLNTESVNEAELNRLPKSAHSVSEKAGDGLCMFCPCKQTPKGKAHCDLSTLQWRWKIRSEMDWCYLMLTEKRDKKPPVVSPLFEEHSSYWEAKVKELLVERTKKMILSYLNNTRDATQK